MESIEQPVRGKGLLVHRSLARMPVLQQVAVLVPLEVADVVLTQQGVDPIVNVLPRIRVHEVDHMLLPPPEGQAAAVFVGNR
ncbi:hypothetical protein D3C73_1319860 [compost metagenome]